MAQQPVLQVDNLTKSFGDRTLFADISFGVAQGDKIGIVARNGAGKSTLLSMLAGHESPDSGDIVWRNDLRIGYLDQSPTFDPSLSVLENVLDGADRSLMHDTDAWSLPDKARSLLGLFGIDDPGAAAATLSGGQAKRAAIVRVILPEPDVLLLDEPTNHLDINIIEWLENYLGHRKSTLLMVTHDRYFLDNVCTRIIEIDREAAYSYDGNYDYYLRRRGERMEAMGAELARVRNLLRTELDWMRRQPQARGSKAKYRIDNFHDLERRSRVDLSEKDVTLDVGSSYIGSKIFEAKGVSKSFGDKCILRDWSYDFARYDKVGIVGPNGIGKSTFIRLLLGELKPDAGHFDIGDTVRWGYYSQQGMTDFDTSKKVIDAVHEIAEEVRIDDKTRLSAQQFLTRFLFTPADQQKYIARLSGGERRRLYLATVLMQSPNFLILDEPTNDLDIMTLSVLEDYLASFKGCVIVVSHDRFFLDRIANHLFVFTGNGEIRDFPGSYSEYRHCLDQEEKERKERREANQSPQKPAGERHRERKPGLTYKERRERETLEAELEALSAERANLESRLSDTSLDHTALQETSERIRHIIERTDEAEMRLLELMYNE